MTHQPIKNIIFDLGGVLLNLDYNLTQAAFERLGFTNFKEMYSQFNADALFERLETGHVTIDEFYRRMLEQAPPHITKKDITLAWNAMLLDFRIDALAYLTTLQHDYRVFLLSNTNAIHFEAFEHIYRRATGQNNFSDYFEKAWYSHKIGLRKPHAEVYEFVLKDAGLLAEETLFIDDSYPNIETAKLLGIKTHLLATGTTIQHVVIN